MSEPTAGKAGRLAWAVWRALLWLATLGLLGVALYAASASSADGPSATPLLMAGLFSLCLMALTLISAIDVLLWASAAGVRWWWRPALVIAVLAGAVLMFELLSVASDPGESVATRRVMLSVYALSVLAALALNRTAVARYRDRRRGAVA